MHFWSKSKIAGGLIAGRRSRGRKAFQSGGGWGDPHLNLNLVYPPEKMMSIKLIRVACASGSNIFFLYFN